MELQERMLYCESEIELLRDTIWRLTSRVYQLESLVQRETGIPISESQSQSHQHGSVNDPTAATLLPRRLPPETDTSSSTRFETIASGSGRSIFSSGSRPHQYAYRYLDGGPTLYSYANTGTVYRTVLTTQTTVTSTLARDMRRPRPSATYIPPSFENEDAGEPPSAGSESTPTRDPGGAGTGTSTLTLTTLLESPNTDPMQTGNIKIKSEQGSMPDQTADQGNHEESRAYWESGSEGYQVNSDEMSMSSSMSTLSGSIGTSSQSSMTLLNLVSPPIIDQSGSSSSTVPYSSGSSSNMSSSAHSALLSKVHQCTYCNKQFRRAQELTVHIRIHTGEKPFSCPVCFKRFSQSSSVKLHMPVHTGWKPYKCSICGKNFARLSHMKKHMKNLHGPRAAAAAANSAAACRN